MKKLAILILVASCVFMAQAASFVWSSGSYRLVDDKGSILTSLDSGSIVLVMLGTDTEKFSDATVADTASIVATGKSSGLGKVSGAYSFAYGDVENGDVFAVLFKDDSGDLHKLQTVSGDEMYTTYTIVGLENDSWDGPQYTFATSNFQASVPEPTTGLLLIVGSALLSLRRKQK